MSFVNPFSNDPERAPVFESGYEAGFSEPEVDHAPPLAPELVDAFTDLERQLASPAGDTKSSEPTRTVPRRRQPARSRA